MSEKQAETVEQRNVNSGQTPIQGKVSNAQAVDGQKAGSEEPAADAREPNRPSGGRGQTANYRGINNGPAEDQLEKIWISARELVPEPHKKQISLFQIQNAIESKKIRNTPSFSELMQIQLQYISPGFWALQGMLLLALILFLHRMPEQGAELEEYLWWSSIAAAWMGVLSHGVLGKHFSNRMAELEQSCCINLTQMWAIRMILTTGADIVILTVFSGGIAARTDTFFGRIAVYLLVPFVLSNICCLSLTSALRGSRGKYAMTVLAVVTAVLATSPSVFPEIYTAAWLWMWFCLLLLGAAVFAGQIRSCYSKMIRGDLICLN